MSNYGVTKNECERSLRKDFVCQYRGGSEDIEWKECWKEGLQTIDGRLYGYGPGKPRSTT